MRQAIVEITDLTKFDPLPTIAQTDQFIEGPAVVVTVLLRSGAPS